MGTVTALPGGSPDATRLQFKLEMYQRALREWAPALDPFEFAIAMRLMDYTIGWGSTSADTTSDRLLATSAQMSRRRMFMALASLEAKGVIRRKGNIRNTTYSINPGWSPDMALAVPKRLRTGASGAPTQCTPCTTPVHEVHSITDTSSTSNLSTDTVPDAGHSGQDAAAKVREVATGARAAHRAHVAGRAARTKGSDRSTGVEAAWRAALLDAFPAIGHAPWDHRVRKNVKLAAQSWLNANQISFEDFASWAVTNWTAIISKQFRWMKQKQPPMTPTISFFLYFIPQFAECWAEGKLDAWMSDSDRTEVERLMNRGMTHEQAMVEIGARQAAKALRKETEEVRRDAAVKLRRATAEAERARRLAETRGAIHPQSAKAKELRGEQTGPEKPTMDFGDYDFGGVPLLDPDGFDD